MENLLNRPGDWRLRHQDPSATPNLQLAHARAAIGRYCQSVFPENERKVVVTGHSPGPNKEVITNANGTANLRTAQVRTPISGPDATISS